MPNKIETELLIEVGNWDQYANALGYSKAYTKRVCQNVVTRIFRVYGIAGMPAILMRTDKVIEIAKVMATQDTLNYQCRGVGIIFKKVVGDCKMQGRIVNKEHECFHATKVSIDGHYVFVDPTILGVIDER